VIRIRYKDFSAGTHEATWLYGRAEGTARGATVYLVPGLTASQRKTVLRRLRQEASRGFGPALPRPQLALALGADRARRAARITGVIVRRRPAVTLAPGALVAVSMTLLVLTLAGGTGISPGSRGAQAAAGTPVRTLVRGIAADEAGGVGLGSGREQRVLVRRPALRRVAAAVSRPATWYARSPAPALAAAGPVGAVRVAAVRGPGCAQPACHRPGPGAAP
jgi:hypothetical protein